MEQISKLADQCLDQLDELEAIIWRMENQENLRNLRNSLCDLVSDYLGLEL